MLTVKINKLPPSLFLCAFFERSFGKMRVQLLLVVFGIAGSVAGAPVWFDLIRRLRESADL